MKYLRIMKRYNGEVTSTQLTENPLNHSFYKQSILWNVYKWIKEYEVDNDGNLRLLLRVNKYGIGELEKKI